MSDVNRESLDLHRRHGGKIELALKVPLDSIDDLSRAYTPGVAAVCEAIRDDRSLRRELTVAGNAVAVVTDGSAVLGLGDIVLLAGLINACRVTGKKFSDMRIVISGAGAAGRAIVRLLRCIDQVPDTCNAVGEVVVCDSKGALHGGRDDLGPVKEAILEYSNPANKSGSLKELLEGADVFIGVSRGGLLDADDIRRLADDPFIFALANPTPEIMPDEAREGGASIIATGRSDFPNQVNNVLAFPGIFRGALDARAPQITDAMKTAAAHAIAYSIDSPDAEHILPAALDSEVAQRVARAVAEAAER